MTQHSHICNFIFRLCLFSKRRQHTWCAALLGSSCYVHSGGFLLFPRWSERRFIAVSFFSVEICSDRIYLILTSFSFKVKVNQSRYRPGVAPEGSTKSRFPNFVTTAQHGGTVGSLTHRPPLTPRKCSWYSFLSEATAQHGGKVGSLTHRPPLTPRKCSRYSFLSEATAQHGGKVGSLTHRPPLTPRKCSWYSFMLEAESTPGP